MSKMVSIVVATLREWPHTSKGHASVAEKEEDSDKNGGETGHHRAKKKWMDERWMKSSGAQIKGSSKVEMKKGGERETEWTPGPKKNAKKRENEGILRTLC